MKKLLLAIALLLCGAVEANAAACFWVLANVSGAVSGTANVCRLTVLNTAGYSTGSAVTVASLVGATECNGSTTVSAVVDSTHIELAGTTFSTAYVSGGTVAGGNWNSTNTNNWASASATPNTTTTSTCLATSHIPGAGTSDSATVDAGSTGTIVVSMGASASSFTLNNLTWGASGGTLDWSVNNNSLNISGSFSGSGTGTRTWKSGTGTLTLTNNTGAPFTIQTTTGLTLSPTAGLFGTPIVFQASTTTNANTRIAHFGGLNYTSISLQDTAASYITLTADSASTVTTLNVGGSGPESIGYAGNWTITNPLTWTGTASQPILWRSNTSGTATTLTLSANSSMNLPWVFFQDTTIADSNAVTITAAGNYGNNTCSGGCTLAYSPPSGGGSSQIIGGGL